MGALDCLSASSIPDVLEKELQSRQMIRSLALIRAEALSFSSSKTRMEPSAAPRVMNEIESGMLSGTISAASLPLDCVR